MLDVLCCIVYILFFFRYSAKEAEQENVIPLPVPFGVTFAILIMLQFWQKYDYQIVFVNVLVLNVFLYCLAHYVENYAKFLNVNKHSVGYMPVKNIFRTGVCGMGIFAFAMSAVMLFVANFGEMNDVVHRILLFIGKIIKRMKLAFKAKGTPDLSIMKETEGNMIEEINAASEVSTLPIWDILATVFFYLIIICLLYKIITLLPYILRFFKLPMKAGNEEEISITDVRERVEVVEKPQRRGVMEFLENVTYARKIRRCYKKRIESTRDYIASKGKKDCMECFTARECADILDMPDMADLYEKARYSSYECTAEDAKRMNEVCKKARFREKNMHFD